MNAYELRTFASSHHRLYIPFRFDTVSALLPWTRTATHSLVYTAPFLDRPGASLFVTRSVTRHLTELKVQPTGHGPGFLIGLGRTASV
ncbi:hypothetical protein PUNSTDRAFT_54173 [Punctularia strigosozonata HHB-11173 SS5]|uniref:uncharacterized protein n=1 Tax=Punctularia strigosozonata (strain HHB-11173) TaxID=741275 RepID=UPI0004416E4D|nr:uncharacterized protein PUNSTDRAFT_54173 [Punctularia strigosozonata HHB-11173 SS5]EIN06803.1 hypothetical protein PUNSTDRAFT_54173 [Punctularia strigosozonata HHB-11173 SS5]